jgi:hypothetical protein
MLSTSGAFAVFTLYESERRMHDPFAMKTGWLLRFRHDLWETRGWPYDVHNYVDLAPALGVAGSVRLRARPFDKSKFSASFGGDVDPKTAAFKVPWGVDAVGGASTEPAWRPKPSWYLQLRDGKMIPYTAQQFMAKRAGATVVDLPEPRYLCLQSEGCRRPNRTSSVRHQIGHVDDCVG